MGTFWGLIKIQILLGHGHFQPRMYGFFENLKEISEAISLYY